MSPLLAGIGVEWSRSDWWIVAAGALCAAACAIPGCFLVLRRMSMMGDAISHAVLPGLAVAFLISNSRDSLWMFVGAIVVGVLTAFFTEWVRRVGNVDEGAAMGVVFTALFALGLVLIVHAADKVDLDPGCVLYGAIEFTPLDTWELSLGSLGPVAIPRAVVILGAVLAVNAIVVMVLFKEFRITAFDPSLARSMGIDARIMHYLLMTLTAVTTVAAFESVGSIVVVAMLIVPAAAAHLLTDRLAPMVIVAVLLGAASSLLGHAGAVVVPHLFGLQATSSAGGMATAAGGLLAIAVLAAPRQGLLVRLGARRAVTRRIVREDLLGLLFRAEEVVADRRLPVTVDALPDALRIARPAAVAAARRVVAEGLVRDDGGVLALSTRGREAAREIVRSHRLWESYLVSEVGVRADHVHGTAERLEHVTRGALRDSLEAEVAEKGSDPHGKPIPAGGAGASSP